MSTPDDLRRLAEESRRRLAALADLREQQRLITTSSRRCLAASRLLLAGARTDPVPAGPLPRADLAGGPAQV